eukprot:snap_masked-scaffold_4-processed-gene-0.33-mRNA-1 protein AED:1.00 eAED:1.00 QI:0/0/0/0/1/1/2/0/67
MYMPFISIRLGISQNGKVLKQALTILISKESNSKFLQELLGRSKSGHTQETTYFIVLGSRKHIYSHV